MQRQDGRQGNELRPRKVQLGELSRYEGSSRYSMGQTVVLASVEGPFASKGNQEQFDAGVVQVVVNHARGTEPAGGGAAKYLVESKRKEAMQEECSWMTTVSRFASWCIMLERYPRCTVEVRVTILNDEGSVLACMINAVQCALLDSGLQCRGTAAAVSAGFAFDGSAAAAAALPELVLDLTKNEEESGGITSSSTSSSSPSSTGKFQLAAGGTFVLSTDGELILSELRQSISNASSDWSFDAMAFFQLKSLSASASFVLFDLLRTCGESCHGMDIQQQPLAKMVAAAAAVGEADAMPSGNEILL